MRGITLIETLVYIALLTLFIGSGIVSAFYIIDSSEKNKLKISATAEAQFLLRKIDWALTGVTIIDSPSSGTSGGTLSVNQADFGDNPIVISLDSNRAQLSRGGSAAEYLTTERVKIENLTFTHRPAQGAKPAAVAVSFTASGKGFEMIKYWRK